MNVTKCKDEDKKNCLNAFIKAVLPVLWLPHIMFCLELNNLDVFKGSCNSVLQQIYT